LRRKAKPTAFAFRHRCGRKQQQYNPAVLEDAIAAEKSFEARLRSFAEEGDDTEVQDAFLTHAEETRVQHERLTARLEALGGGRSAVKSFLEQLFAVVPKPAQVGNSGDERLVQNLVIAFAVEQSECAMYEALANAAVAAGDPVTEDLAREIQAQESATGRSCGVLSPRVRRSPSTC
jgi:ferritin-like metal-binding protein YciE